MIQRKVWIGGAIIAMVAVSGMVCIWNIRKDENTGQEKAIRSGTLSAETLGDGNLKMGTTTQTFDLDLSAFEAQSNSNDYGGGMGGFFAFGGGTQNGNDTATARSLKVEEVLVAVGQSVKEGDVLARLSEETLKEIREELSLDVQKAFAQLEALAVSQEKSKMTMNQTYTLHTSYGNAASQYEKKVQALDTDYVKAETELGVKMQELISLQTEISEKDALYQTCVSEWQMAEENKASVTKEADMYWYLQYLNTAEELEDKKDSMEEELETMREEEQELEQEIAMAKISLSKLAAENKVAKAEAESTYQQKQISYSNAEQLKAIEQEYLDLDYVSATNEYEAAKKKLDTFDALIVDGNLVATGSGILSKISISKGDAITTNHEILTVQDIEQVTIEIKVTKEDMEEVSLEQEVNVTLMAYPDQEFTAIVTEIGAASVDAQTYETTYPVTVTLQGDLTGLLEGMSAEVSRR